ncbi:MAG TPA: hypothetical protein VE988_17205 [Gemmataceae bacterium]|nr:hypothetical protein [Gemmataceae bacterium]
MKKRFLWLALAFLGAYVLVSSGYTPAQDAKADPAKTQETKWNP